MVIHLIYIHTLGEHFPALGTGRVNNIVQRMPLWTRPQGNITAGRASVLK